MQALSPNRVWTFGAAACAFAIWGLVAVSGIWRPVEYSVFGKWFLRESPIPLRELHLIDVPYDSGVLEDQQFANYRRRMAATLTALADHIQTSGEEPKAVVLDVTFTKPADDGVPALVDAIKRVRSISKSTLLLGVINPWKDGVTELDAEYATRHIADIYERLDASGHTQMEQFGPILKYQAALTAKTSGQNASIRLAAMPILLAEQLFQLSSEHDPGILLVPLGERNRILQHKAEFGSASSVRLSANPFGSIGLRNSVLIFGNLAADVENPYNRSGPELLAWAISDLAVHERNRVTRYPINSPLAILAISIAAAALTLLFFGWLFRWTVNRAVGPIKASQLACAAATSLLLGALVVMIAAVSLLAIGRLLPITLPLVAAMLAASACWLLARIDLAQAGRDPKKYVRMFAQRFNYDIFVSYSREPSNAYWVKSTLVDGLVASRRSDGEPLSLFFDQSDIVPGERWEDKVLASLASSKIFLLIVSTDYFSKEYCKLEYQLTKVLQQAKRGPILIIPIVRDLSVVPDELQAIQFLDAADSMLIEKLIDRVSTMPG